jgi:pyrroloquinoline quinone biosynthesis protein D
MNEPQNPLLASVPKFPRGVRLKHDEARQEWVLLAPERLIKCDAIAAAILQLCDGKRTLGDIVAKLAETFKADQSMIERDVTALLQGLSDKKMVQL